MNIWFASNNLHKKNELEAVLGTSLKIPSDEELSFNPDETGLTFCDNALIKAKELYMLIGQKGLSETDNLIIADDSGLCVDALNGRPGVHSARYGNTEKLILSSAQQNLLLLDELGNNTKRSARFVCSMVLLFNYDRFFVAQETLEGEITKKNDMKGDGGFGYDPIFFIREYNKTLAELSQEEKNLISHRGKSARVIQKYLYG